MWSVGSRVSDVYLGTRALAVCEEGASVLALDVCGFAAGLEALAQWLNSAPHRQRLRLRLWLSGGLCRPFIMPAVQGVANAAEAKAVATTLAPQHTGLTGPCTVFVERSAATEPVLAIATQDDRLRQMRNLLASHERKPRVLSIRPWWAEVLRHSLRREPALSALGVQDCDSMTILIGNLTGGFETVATYSPVTDEATAQSALTRALLSATSVERGSELVGRLVLRQASGAERSPGLALGALVDFSR